MENFSAFLLLCLTTQAGSWFWDTTLFTEVQICFVKIKPPISGKQPKLESHGASRFTKKFPFPLQL